MRLLVRRVWALRHVRRSPLGVAASRRSPRSAAAGRRPQPRSRPQHSRRTRACAPATGARGRWRRT
eukprot:5168444-Prymnesium_polylepis.1